ncbi:MAG: FmdB family zinc ribbon protein, partial [Acidimicrobiales bacterium]
MPTYEYKCTECDERFEIEQSIKDDTLTVWPGDDHEHQLKKVFSAVGIAFKGQGFYKNDARKSGSKSSSSASTSGDSSSSDTKSSSDSKGSTSS